MINPTEDKRKKFIGRKVSSPSDHGFIQPMALEPPKADELRTRELEYASKALNEAGGMTMGKRGRPAGWTYDRGKYRGMTQSQAYEAARQEARDLAPSSANGRQYSADGNRWASKGHFRGLADLHAPRQIPSMGASEGDTALITEAQKMNRDGVTSRGAGQTSFASGAQITTDGQGNKSLVSPYGTASYVKPQPKAENAPLPTTDPNLDGITRPTADVTNPEPVNTEHEKAAQAHAAFKAELEPLVNPQTKLENQPVQEAKPTISRNIEPPTIGQVSETQANKGIDAPRTLTLPNLSELVDPEPREISYNSPYGKKGSYMIPPSQRQIEARKLQIQAANRPSGYFDQEPERSVYIPRVGWSPNPEWEQWNKEKAQYDELVKRRKAKGTDSNLAVR